MTIKQTDLTNLFAPRSLAMVGASADTEKIGGRILRNILDGGFKGSIHPVNPKGGEIFGLPVLTSVDQLPWGIDLAILAIPKKAMAVTITQAVARGVKNLVALTAGFKETGREGARQEEEIRDLIKESGSRLVGPNCAGLCDTWSGLHASLELYPRKGAISLISQSGSLCSAMTSNLARRGAGIAKYISVGNKLDVGVADLVEHLGNDPETRCIALYLEDLPDGKRFVEVAAEVSLWKPIVVLKAGRTAAGARATLSHTGALAGEDAVAEGAFRKAGLIRVDRLTQLYDLAAAASIEGSMPGPNLTVLSDAGGPGVLATDAAESQGLLLPEPSPAARRELKGILPDFASLRNPVDMTFTRDANLYRKCMEVLAKDGSDGFVVTIPSHFAIKEKLASLLVAAKERLGVPFAVAWLAGDEVEEQKRFLWRGRVSCFDSPEAAVYVMGRLAWRGAWLKARKKEGMK